MKSETYQKEGWLILEEENQFFGKNAEDTDNLKSEDFYFYRQNKEKAKKNIDNSAKEINDFIDCLIKDVPDPSQEEIDRGIEKILQKAYPEKTEIKPIKSKKNRKAAFKVLFVAAVLSVVCFSSLFAVGNTHNISIENGFVSFAKQTVQVVFFGGDEEEYISVDSLLKDLEKHGYNDILFPEIFITKSDNYKASVPEYYSDEVGKQLTFDMHSENEIFKFFIYSYNPLQQSFDYIDVENIKTIAVDDITVYILECDDEASAVEFTNNKYRYYIRAEVPYSDIISIISTMK